MSKVFKFLLIFVLFLFSGFIFLGLVMYVVYFLYTRYKKEIIITFRKYPEIEYVLRKIASFTSIEMQEDSMSNLQTENIVQSVPKSNVTKNINSRQSAILKLLADNEKMEMSDIKKNFPNITVRTLRRDLSGLETKNLISKSGKTKGSFYTIQ